MDCLICVAWCCLNVFIVWFIRLIYGSRNSA